MIETKEEIIDGDNYTVTQFPARKAINIKAKLLRLFGSSLAQLVLNDDTSDNLNLKNQSMISAFQDLTANLNEKDFENLVVVLLSSVRKNGIELTPEIIDLEFAGQLETLYKVLWFVLRVNYESFFMACGITNLYDMGISQGTKQSKKAKYQKV